MTKAAELALLDKTITAFGRDSYLGPWLTENRLSIERDLAIDFEPSAPMPGEARKEALAILATATAEATRKIEDAEKRAKAIVEAAQTTRAGIAESLRRQLSRAAEQVW